jgi:hypothetical protein
MSDITQVQRLHLELIRCISFNDFNGALVADGLLAQRHLWVGVISAHSHRPHPALRLFEELPENTWFTDTLWIMAVDLESAKQLIRFCRQEWNADEAGIYSRQDAERLLETTMIDAEVLVRAWWD